jgi:hypothetical protein
MGEGFSKLLMNIILVWFSYLKGSDVFSVSFTHKVWKGRKQKNQGVTNDDAIKYCFQKKNHSFYFLPASFEHCLGCDVLS